MIIDFLVVQKPVNPMEEPVVLNRIEFNQFILNSVTEFSILRLPYICLSWEFLCVCVFILLSYSIYAIPGVNYNFFLNKTNPFPTLNYTPNIFTLLKFYPPQIHFSGRSLVEIKLLLSDINLKFHSYQNYNS